MAGETYAVPMSKPAKLGDEYVFLPTAAKQVIMDDEDTERLPAALARKFDASYQLSLEEYAAMNPKPPISAVYDRLTKFGDLEGLSQNLQDILNATETFNLNSITKSGTYYFRADASNKPFNYGYLLHLTTTYDQHYTMQIAVSVNEQKLAFRGQFNGNWKDWKIL